MTTLGIVPARGGSSLHRKNLQDVDGTPLAVKAARTLAEVCDDVWVSTDDPETVAVCQAHGLQVLHRPDPLADADTPVTEVARHAAHVIDNPQQTVVLLQPTCPAITADTVRDVADHATSAGAVVAAVRERHNLWTLDGPVVERRQRQDKSGVWREVGLYAWGPQVDAGCEPSAFLPINPTEAVDVDTYLDLHRARQPTGRITFHVTAGPRVGTGHLSRCLTLASRLAHHDVRFAVDGPRWAWRQVNQAGFRLDEWVDGVHVVDMLDTTREQIASLARDGRVVTLEDLGEGTRIADYVINSLYAPDVRRHATGEFRVGPDWHVLDPTFLGFPQRKPSDLPQRILVTFGGTDPACLTERIGGLLTALPTKVVTPPNRAHAPGEPIVSMAAELASADLVVCSAGRTVYEAAAVGCPAVVVAANPREATHAHLGEAHGNVYLGLHATVSDDRLLQSVTRLAHDPYARQDLAEAGRKSVDGLGARRIARLVGDLMEGL